MLQTGSDLIKGTVYGVALFSGEMPSPDIAGSPQPNAPTSPVLFIKPRNTFLATGGTVEIPDSVREVEAKPALALVFGRDISRVSAEEALGAISGFTLAIDLSEPASSMLRPPIREKCRDGFLPIGPKIFPLQSTSELEPLGMRLLVNGKEVAVFSLSERLPLLAQLIEEVSRYMTFRKGDVLLMESAASSAPRVAVGSHLCVAMNEVDLLECSLVAEEVLQ